MSQAFDDLDGPVERVAGKEVPMPYNRELEQASLAKTQILATVTHELKTPLTSIVGYIDRMLEQDIVGVLNQRQERYLERAQRNS